MSADRGSGSGRRQCEDLPCSSGGIGCVRWQRKGVEGVGMEKETRRGGRWQVAGGREEIRGGVCSRERDMERRENEVRGGEGRTEEAKYRMEKGARKKKRSTRDVRWCKVRGDEGREGREE